MSKFEWETTENLSVRRLHLSKRLSLPREKMTRDQLTPDMEKSIAFIQSIVSIDGVEGLDPQNYSLTIVFARCFEIDPIIETINGLTETFLSEIRVASVMPKKLQIVK